MFGRYWVKIFILMGSCLYVGFLCFYDGLSCFPLNEAPIYIEKHMLKLAKAFTMKMTPCIYKWYALFGP